MHNTPFKLTAIFAAITMLAACGGGGGDSTTSGTLVTTVTPTPAFSDCFVLTPGTKFVLNDGYKMLVVQEPFNGQTAYGYRELRPNDSTFGTTYMAKDDSYITLLGNLDDSGSTNVYTGYRFPANMSAGQTANITYSEVDTVISPPPTPSPQTFTYNNQTASLTFVGFEDLTLGGKTFAHTCKISSPYYADATKTDYSWFAKGFGWIRRIVLDAQGNAVPSTLRELTSVVAAP
jgi:hypothetical protein